MTAAEASIAVQEETDKKGAQNTEVSEEKKPDTGADGGDGAKTNDDKSPKSAKDDVEKKECIADDDAPTTEKDAESKKASGGKTEDGDKTENAEEAVTTDSKKHDNEASAEDQPDEKKEHPTPANKGSEDPGVEAKMHLLQGKRNILVQDYAMAVDSLQKACELLAAKYGDDASECAEALHYYGKALLELHRKESGALNDMETQEGAEDDSSDENDDEDKDDEEEKEKKEGDGSSGEEKGDDDAGDQTAKDEEDLEGETEANGTDKENREAIGDEEDVTNLQIAFEVLELAKKIYKRDAEKDPQLYLKAADCLLSLGEINLESDTYDRAIEDFEECLRIQQEMLPRDARVMAETNYQLGLTYSFVNKYEQSAAFFGDALQILELKVSNLKKSLGDEKAKGEKPASEDDDVVRRADEEIEEIQKLLPEIAAKIEDAKEMQRDNSQGPKEKIIGEMLNRTPEASPVKAETKVNVISASLIKRKRPLADDAEAAGSSSKEHAEKKLKEN